MTAHLSRTRDDSLFRALSLLVLADTILLALSGRALADAILLSGRALAATLFPTLSALLKRYAHNAFIINTLHWTLWRA